MQVILRAMQPAEWHDFEVKTKGSYAETLATATGTSSRAASRRADAEHTVLLPQGIDTPDHWFYVIETEDGNQVGTIWFAAQDDHGTRYAYLYNLEVDPEHRSAGVGEAAMTALEDEAQRRGLAWIDLSVAAMNGPALRLYRRLDYEETFVKMRKLLA